MNDHNPYGTHIKICGLTTLTDAQAAIDAGAAYLGFIFYAKSPRYVTRAVIEEIAPHIPKAIRKVGVFVNGDPAAIQALLMDGLIDFAQLHGEEPPERVVSIPGAFKAIRPANLVELRANIDMYPVASHPVDLLLPGLHVDAYHPNLYGGTGVQVDTELAQEAVARIPRLMFAGGLTPKNVGAAVRNLHPFAIDVSSGVESAPGVKDHAKIRSFVQAVREAGQT